MRTTIPISTVIFNHNVAMYQTKTSSGIKLVQIDMNRKTAIPAGCRNRNRDLEIDPSVLFKSLLTSKEWIYDFLEVVNNNTHVAIINPQPEQSFICLLIEESLRTSASQSAGVIFIPRNCTASKCTGCILLGP